MSRKCPILKSACEDLLKRDRVGFQIDSLDVDDPHQEHKYDDLQGPLYSHITDTERKTNTDKNRLKATEESRITTENI
jgi:hypothetical protein